MINAEFLSQCSDEQVNRGVSWIEASKAGIKRHGFFIASKHYCNKVTMGCAMFSFEPCTNPSDIMPIAFANGIAIMPDSDGSWKSGRLPSNPEMTFGWSNFVRGYKNPLRAICEVYILMSVNK